MGDLGVEDLRPALDTVCVRAPFAAAPLVRGEVGLLDFVPLPAEGDLGVEGLRPALDTACAPAPFVAAPLVRGEVGLLDCVPLLAGAAFAAALFLK